MSQLIRTCLFAVAVATATACADRDPAMGGDTVAAVATVPGSTIDSIIPLAEALRRFRQGLPAVTALGNAAPSRDSLVGMVLGSLERSDTLALLATQVTKAEYAYLYYPTSIYASKPYELAPEIAWMLSNQNNDKGRNRLVSRIGGQKLRPTGNRCDSTALEGENRLWRECTVTYVEPVSSVATTRRIIGAIVERNGLFKVLSFSNDF